MTQFIRLAGAALLVLVVSHSTASAQDQRVNVRGTITAVAGTTLTIKTIAGADVVVDLPAEATVATTKTFAMADVKPGMILGVTTIKRADGAIVAIDVRPIPPAAPQGLSPWDLAPDATMTNATVEATVAAAGGQELTLNYKTGAIKVLVVPETAMSQSAPGTRDDLKVGETAFVFARKAADGKLTAGRVQVSKDGIKPTQ